MALVAARFCLPETAQKHPVPSPECSTRSSRSDLVSCAGRFSNRARGRPQISSFVRYMVAVLTPVRIPLMPAARV